MRRQLRSESAVELGQWLASELLEAPVKEAVHEALAEERAAPPNEGEDGRSDAGNGSKAPPVAAILAGLTAIGVVYLLRERSQSNDGYPTRPSDVDEGTPAGDRVEAEAPVESGS